MKYEIYQLKEDTMEQVKLRFMASDQAAQLGGIHRENYRRVYGGEIPSVPEVVRMLLRLFALFNGSNRPVDFSGHSMSMSENNIRVMLNRTRNKLRDRLEKEGYLS